MELYDLYGFCSCLGSFIWLASLLNLAEIWNIIESFFRKKRITLTVYEIYTEIFKKRARLAAIIVNVLLLIISLLANKHFLISLGSEDLRIMPKGNYCYYVYATNEKGKTYTLPAKIHKDGKLYYVENVYFNNGGYLYFEDHYENYTFSETQRLTDQNDKDWEIKLTNIRSFRKNFNSSLTYGFDVFLFYSMAILSFACVIIYIFIWR